MRNLIDTINVLNESTGLAGRKPGDVFKNDAGDTITFSQIEFFPEAGGRLPHPELDEIITQLPPETMWMNDRTSRTGGIAFATFSGEDGELYFGRYMENIKPNFTSNFVPNKVGDYRYVGGAGAKMQSNLTPQDLLTQRNDLTIDDIIEQLRQSMGPDNALYQVAVKIAQGAPLPLTFEAPTDVAFTAFRDYFCEILQPIALMKGQYTGNAGEAAERFLGVDTFSDENLISFDDSKTSGLSDSIISTADGKYVKISTKGGKGATASTGNLVNSVNELMETDAGRRLIEKYQDTVNLIREIQKQGQAGAPLFLGMKYGIIGPDDADEIRGLKDSAPVSEDDIDTVLNSDRLKKLAKDRKITDPNSVNLYYHIMAAVAHLAAEEVNERTDFSDAASDILNNGALVQVYTKAKEGKGQWTLSEFDTVYPGESIDGVYLSAAKTYYSTGIKGNYTFKIDKGSGKPETDDLSNDGTDSQPGRSEREEQDITRDIALGRNRRVPRKDNVGDVGRSKR